MPAPIIQTLDWKTGFDTIIDVRSPTEYADDHIPGAINLPVLTDAERSTVGTLYKQKSPFEARKLGAALISQNISKHLDNELKQYSANWLPLIYCWRGGQRSGAMARILSEIGWYVHILEGGYKSYRHSVQINLAENMAQLKPIIIDGATGVGKTMILHAMAYQDIQYIDLEGLAVHRGSVLGGIPNKEQPSQRLFESQLLHAFSQLDLSKPVLFEAESSKIGQIHIPDCLWKSMLAAPCITITANLSTRVNYILSDYEHIISDPTALNKLISGMVRRHGYEITKTWSSMIADKNWVDLVTHLIETHYDPAYEGSSKRRQRDKLGVINMKLLDKININRAAKEIADLVNSTKVIKN